MESGEDKAETITMSYKNWANDYEEQREKNYGGAHLEDLGPDNKQCGEKN